MIVETCKRHGIRPETLTIYADRGSPMTATSTALLLANLGDGGIGLMTPWTVQTGRAEAVRNARQDVLNQAFQSHPLRFVCETPQPPAPPNAVWINPPNLKIAA